LFKSHEGSAQIIQLPRHGGTPSFDWCDDGAITSPLAP
jgi:hypothetical protein